MPKTTRKDDVIQIRISTETEAILNRAAALRGQELSEFVLESARRQAEEAILDQGMFFLDPTAHEKFLSLLDTPAKRTKKLKALMQRKAAWER